ncbi:hypothetical protein HY994_02035 [Candidatus Micrarchaeota archaeon]|nr:hypothetical protein [Candidatus Micrarchaeota archaeon]
MERGTKIHLSLQDIKKALLEEEVTYRTAHHQLYIQTPNGEKTKLQVFLENVAQDNSSAQMTRKERVEEIQKRLNDVSKQFGKRFGQDSKLLFRSESAIGDWLSGETVLPRDFRVLRILRKLGPTHFDSLFGKPSELKEKSNPDPVQHPLKWAHDHWSNVHATLMRWAEGNKLDPKENEKEFELPEDAESEGKRKKTSSGMDAARNVVYERLIKNIVEIIDTEHKFTRVKAVEFLKPQEEREHTAKREVESLPRGVVAAKNQPLDELDVPETQARAIYREHLGMLDIITKFLNKERIPGADNVETPQGGWGEPVGDLLRIIEEGKHTSHDHISLPIFINGKPQIIKLTYEYGQELAQKLRQKIESGKIDEENGVSKGTFRKIYDRAKECGRADPVYELIGEHNRSAAFIGRTNATATKQGRKDEVKRINDLAEQIQDYDVIPGSFASPVNFGVKTKTSLDAYMERNTKIMRSYGLRLWGFEPPHSHAEMTQYLENTGLSQDDIRKVIHIFGHENFVE